MKVRLISDKKYIQDDIFDNFLVYLIPYLDFLIMITKIT